MVHNQRWITAGVLTTLAVSLAIGPSGAAPPRAAASPTISPPSGLSSEVTLITGDKVIVTPREKTWTVKVEPARRPGPQDGFLRQVTPAGVTVIPMSALPLVRSGVLDRALFDVTGLIRQKLDDAHSKELPLLVQSSNVRAVTTFGKVTRQLPAARLAAVSVRRPFDLSNLPAKTKIWLNGRAKPSLDVSVPQIGAPAAWQAGYTGAGVKVAVLDSGYDASHPDLKGVVKGEKNFLGDGSGIKDEVGHGTHVASIVAGRGSASGGKYTGVAKGADLLIGKVCGIDGCPYDTIIAGMQWAAASGAKVVNLSLGGDWSDGADPISLEVNRLTAATGALFVVAAGNDGPTGKVSSPAAADSAVAVASVTKQDELSDFSSVGPRYGDYAMKPDVAAPGSDIVAARAAGTYPDEAVDKNYTRLSGTSMATPHVAGVAAILAAEHPDWKAPQLKAALMGSAHPVNTSVYGQGAGRVDLARGIGQRVLAAPTSVSFKAVGWPHDRPQNESKQVVYSNDFDTAITLNLRLEVRNSAGAAAPAGLFKTSANSVVVPAHGQAKVTVSVAPSNISPDTYGGRLVASSADAKTVVQTPLGVYLEGESYNLTIAMKDRAGAPISPETLNGRAVVTSIDSTDIDYYPVLPGDKVRLPAGRYAVLTEMYTPIPGRLFPSTTTAAVPELDLRRDTTLSFDARHGRRTSFELDAKDAKLLAGTTGMEIHSDKVDTGLINSLGPDNYAIPTKGKVDHFSYYTRAQLERPLARVTFNGKDLGATWLAGTAFVGTRRLTAVDVGRARPEDLDGKDVRGKVAVFTLSKGEGSDFAARISLLEKEGAAVALWNETEYVGVDPSGVKLPALAVDDPMAGRIAGKKVTVIGNGSSPYRYELALPSPGKIPASLTYRVPNSGLGAVQARYHAFAPSSVGYMNYGTVAGRIDMGSYLWSAEVAMPTTRTEYYSAGADWSWGLLASATPDGPFQRYGLERHNYKPGEKGAIVWAKPVFGPAFSVNLDRTRWAFRNSDSVTAALPLFGDSANHYGLVAAESNGFAVTGETSLYADGKLVGKTDLPGQGIFKVPAGEAAYRLVSEVRRDHPAWPLATRVSAEWTFRSRTTSAPESLPLLAVRLDPKLDLLDYAPAGKRFAIPVSVPGGWLKSVEASYDDGAHWQKAAISKSGSGWTATITHPASGFVSLRSTATGTNGSGVTQTTIRAYRLK